MSNTAEGMRGYKPRRPGTTLDDVVTPEIRAKRASMIEEAKDEARKKTAGDAYDKAMPNPYKKGGSVDKSQDKAMIKKAFKQHDAQEHKGGKGTSLKLAKGGKTRRYAIGGMTDAEQEAADKAAGLEASNKEPSAGFFARLKAGNIDEPGSEAYEKYGAGRGKALRTASAPVVPSASAKMEKPESVSQRMNEMGEDERPAPTGMGAATVLAPAKAAQAKPAMPVRKAEPAPVKAAKPAMPVSSRNSVANPDDELEAYEKMKKNKQVANSITPEEKARRKKMETDQALSTEEPIIGGAARFGLKGIAALAKRLASSKSKTELTRSTAPYLKEIGMNKTALPKPGTKYGEGFVMYKKGGMAKGGFTGQESSASRRGDGIATKGKTRGKMVQSC